MLRGAPQFLHFISETMPDVVSILDCSRIELMKAEISSLTQRKRIGRTRRTKAHYELHDHSRLRHLPRPHLRHIQFLPRPCLRISIRPSRSLLPSTSTVPDRPSHRPSHQPPALSGSGRKPLARI